MSNDKAQIGLSSEGQQWLTAVYATGWFGHQQDVYRFAVGVAIANRLQVPANVTNTILFRLNFAGGLDRDGTMRALISVLVPAEAATPASYSERAAHVGLEFLAKRAQDPSLTLTDLMRPVSRAAEGDGKV